MAKIVLFMVTSVDGYFEGPNHDISWHMVDDEFNDFAQQQLEEIDTLLFGHRTYDLMAGYWPTNLAEDDPVIAKIMNEKPKIVFSHQQFNVTWQNTRLVTDNVKEEIKKLKAKPGQDLAIFGSNNLCVSLMEDDLVDEFRIMVCPVAIGEGSSLFTGLKKRQSLKLISNREFGNGNVLLTYQRA